MESNLWYCVQYGTSMLNMRDVTKRYPSRTALAGISLDVSAGEIYVLLGPNGAGKTTTLRILAGLTAHDEGAIRMHGSIYRREDPECRRRVAYVPEQPFLYSRLTGEEHALFFADLYEIPAAERMPRLDFLFEHLEFSDYRHEPVELYSTGTRQKLLLAQALSVRPELLLLDEPLVSVDPLVSRKVKALLKKETQRGTAILFATHLLSLAAEVADRIGIIVNGRIHREITRTDWCAPGSPDLEEWYTRTVTNHDLLVP